MSNKNKTSVAAKQQSTNTKLSTNKGGKQTDLNCGNKGGKAVAQKKVTVSKVEDDDSYGAGSNESSFSQSSVEEVAEVSVDDSGKNNVSAKNAEMSAEMKASEANIKWDKLEYHFDHEFDLNEYVTEGSKGQLKLENKGNLLLSTENGMLRAGYRTKAPDFTSMDSSVNASSSGAKKRLEQNSDIVKSVHLEHFKISGWDEKVVLNLTSVNKFQEEGHVGDSDTVNHMIYPSEWKNTKTAKPIEIIDRTITNSMMNFQKRFPGVNPENLARGITKSDEDHYLVDLESPMVAIINLDEAADTPSGKYELSELVKTQSPIYLARTNQVLIPKAIVRTYRAKTLDEMSKSISYANITDGRFAISFEVPVPSSLLAKHQDYVSSKGTSGRQFLAFADTPYKSKIGNLGSSVSETAKLSKSTLLSSPEHRFVRVEGKLVIHYKRINQDTLEDL